MFTELMALCVLINKSSPHNIFCEFYGHINSLNIKVYQNGWVAKTEPSYQTQLREDDDVVPTLEYLTSLLRGET